VNGGPQSNGYNDRGSVPEGEQPTPFTPDELAARNARGSEHIVFDEPITP
jgi:hypothetical protein